MEYATELPTEGHKRPPATITGRPESWRLKRSDDRKEGEGGTNIGDAHHPLTKLRFFRVFHVISIVILRYYWVKVQAS